MKIYTTCKKTGGFGDPTSSSDNCGSGIEGTFIRPRERMEICTRGVFSWCRMYIAHVHIASRCGLDIAADGAQQYNTYH